MIKLLKDWNGPIEYNGMCYDSVTDVINALERVPDDIHIVLRASARKAAVEDSRTAISDVPASDEVVITVKQYMTKRATPEFDFMAKWNGNNPMPLRIMAGTKEKETKGMVYMKLHGLCKPTIVCTCCGKELTNPVSRHYGVGPICLGKMGITADISDVDTIREELVKVEWEGWIIKSAITNEEKEHD